MPSKKKIEILVNFFESCGINVSVEWIEKGIGYPPVNADLKKFNTADFDELAYTTLIDVRQRVKDFHFFQVSSNFFRPIISFGDYVGGITETNKKIIDKKLCFLITASLVVAGTYHYETNSISNLSGDNQSISNETIKIGEIQWIIRRP